MEVLYFILWRKKVLYDIFIVFVMEIIIAD
ncbi:Uncharacterised protein [Mycobacteroides abscessus subsp. abscessus]|nr:Uncharacterised protein [Mycobacteroides abscessus subsp. abscessus]